MKTRTLSTWSGLSPGPELGAAAPAGSAPADLLLRLTDFGLALVVFAAPLAMGGRHPLGRLVLVAAIGVAASAWLVGQWLSAEFFWRRSGVEWLLLAGLALVLLQLAPLPPSLLARLSPAAGRLLPLWTAAGAEGSLGTWNRVSLTPEATRLGLDAYLAYALLFLVVVQRIGDLRDVERLLRWLALAAALMAAIGIAQRLAGNGKFLWVYEHPSRSTHGPVKGTFANENHFAQFLALGVAPMLWWIQSLGRKPTGRSFSFRAAAERRVSGDALPLALGAGLTLIALAGLLSFSTGGVLVLFLASAGCVAGLAKLSLLGRKSLAALAAAGLVAAAALAVYGYQPLAREMEKLRPASAEEFNKRLGRKEIWSADRRAISHFAVMGAGIGSHREVYPIYFAKPSPVEYTHAESGYLQVLLEAGAPGFILLMLGIGACCFWCVRGFTQSASRGAAACAVAVSSSLAASAIHSIWDFVWYIPACMSLAVILAACACRLSQMAGAAGGSRRVEVRAPRWAAAATAAAVLTLSALLIQDHVPSALAAPHWERYLKLSLQNGAASPDSPRYADTLDAMTQHLEEALRRNPEDPRANLRMAAMQLRQFDLRQRSAANPMSLSQIRDAALASHFRSRKAQDQWLAVALGDNRQRLDRALAHVRRALSECPLQGRGYVYLAELAFLEGAPRSANTAYIRQALRVRPHNAEVLLAAGGEAALVGDVPGALAFWKEAFHQGIEPQQRLIELLAPAAPASFFLDNFQPDLQGARLLYRHYRELGRTRDAQVAAAAFVQALRREAAGRKGPAAARLWWETASVLFQCQDPVNGIACAQLALQQSPDDFAMHRGLAARLLAAGRFAEAVEQLQWCRRRKPFDTQIDRDLTLARRKQLELSERREASTTPPMKSSRR